MKTDELRLKIKEAFKNRIDFVSTGRIIYHAIQTTYTKGDLTDYVGHCCGYVDLVFVLPVGVSLFDKLVEIFSETHGDELDNKWELVRLGIADATLADDYLVISSLGS